LNKKWGSSPESDSPQTVLRFEKVNGVFERIGLFIYRVYPIGHDKLFSGDFVNGLVNSENFRSYPPYKMSWSLLN